MDDTDDIEYNRLFKFGAFMSNHFGAGPINLNNNAAGLTKTHNYNLPV